MNLFAEWQRQQKAQREEMRAIRRAAYQLMKAAK